MTVPIRAGLSLCIGMALTTGAWANSVPGTYQIVAPQDSTRITLPGRMQAEHYTDYFDTTPGNTGGAFRDDDVDIEVTTDSGGGYNVGWIDASEYLRYRVSVRDTGRYRVTARVASPHSDRHFRLRLNGIDMGRVDVPNTGGWQNWADVSFDANLSAGDHEIEAYFDTDLFNLNYVDFEYLDDGHGGGSNPEEPGDGWRLVWSDEFNGNQIDPAKWNHAVDAWGGGNNELQYYTDRPENSYVSDGTLKIVAHQERFTGPEGTRDYTSARLNTRHKGDWRYGRIEVRARMPYGQGLWPAIWMMPTDSTYGGWAASGEIDIFEAVNTRGSGGNTVHGTLHYGGGWPDNVHSGSSFEPSKSIVDHFHVYAVEWEPGEIRWYVDDEHYQTQREWWSANAPYPAPFDQKFYLILNVAVGGDWPGSPDGSTRFPQVMEVDYVRVYQK